jgi:hypothetical protein
MRSIMAWKANAAQGERGSQKAENGFRFSPPDASIDSN